MKLLRYILVGVFLTTFGQPSIQPITANSNDLPVIEHCGTIYRDTTWSNTAVHRITCEVWVTSGAVLTIEPGTTVKTVGVSDELILVNGARLRAIGTAFQPILFTADTPNPYPGAWEGFVFKSGASGIFDYVIIEYAGGGSSWDNPNRVVEMYYGASSLLITNSVIRYGLGSGVYVASGSVTIHNSSITDISNYGIYNETQNTVDATSNWWGSSDGPSSNGQPCNTATGSGSKVSCYVSFSPWLSSAPGSCVVPFFSQVDDNWKEHPLRTDENSKYKCSAYCSTIGHCGCTLTSAAMVFNAYGTNTNPPQLSDCMDKSACPYNWGVGATCSSNKARFISRPEFSWSGLDRELNQNHRLVILGMCKKGTCQFDYDDDPNTYTQTHGVVVLSGQGDNPVNYHIHDPAFKCGASLLLSTRSTDWEFTQMGIYESNVPCGSLMALTPPCVSRGANPQPVQFNSPLSVNTISLGDSIASPASVMSGTVWIYTRTELTMTVEITAASSVGNITDMVIWSDTIPNTNWQSFTPFVWLPVSEFVYARFRDNLGNVTDVYSDTINPVGPPTAPFQVFLPIIGR